MKTITRITWGVLLILALVGCNGEVFVEDFRPSVTELTLDGNGDSATIHFDASNWEELGLSNYYGESVRFDIYDEHGTLLERQTNFPYIKGLGKIVCDDGKLIFTVARTAPDAVEVIVDENVHSFPFSFILYANNEYESKKISVTIPPSDRYRFQRIDYSLNGYAYDGNQSGVKERMIINTAGAPRVFTWYPYRDEYRVVKFESDDLDAFDLLEEKDLVIEIPSMVDGFLEMKGERMVYNREYQKLPLPFSDEEEKRVEIPSYSSLLVSLWLQYEWFETRYTLYAVHPKTGRQRTIEGVLQSKMPVDYFITREDYHE